MYIFISSFTGIVSSVWITMSVIPMSLLVEFFSPKSLQLGRFTKAFMNNEIKDNILMSFDFPFVRLFGVR